MVEISTVKMILDEIVQETRIPSITLTARRGDINIFSSKLGGTPYLPPNFVYPKNKSQGSKKMPLKLLAQINFATMPKLKNFPEKGILQFFIAYEECDDLFGLDLNDFSNQDSFRVVYHENVIEDESLLKSPPLFINLDEYLFPFTGEFELVGELSESTITSSDFRFEKIFLDKLSKHVDHTYSSFYELGSECSEFIVSTLNSSGHKIGGNPFFAESDPRYYAENLREYSTLLLQLDTQTDKNYEIIWGDAGIANLFIKPEDLANQDFSNIMYFWD